ncbi:hypothetical protein KM427_12715 [Nocardioides sp. LMS-CY]|nr:hypothetical protein KM427_12715 [Nocardioides sp. LMS-CY]
MADLADHFPQSLGRLHHAVYSPPDWNHLPTRRVPVRDGYVELNAVPQDDTHVILLRTSQRTTFRVLVVPVEFTTGQGEEALLAATTAGYTHSAACLLDTVTDQLDVDPADRWG